MPWSRWDFPCTDTNPKCSTFSMGCTKPALTWNSTVFQNFSAVFINALIRAARLFTRLPALPRLGRREVFFCFLEQRLEFRFARPNEPFDSQILRFLATLINLPSKIFALRMPPFIY